MMYGLHNIIEPITFFLLNTSPNCIEIKKTGDHQSVYYHDKWLKNSPIKFPPEFDVSFTRHQILKDTDLCKWLESVTGYKPKLTWSL